MANSSHIALLVPNPDDLLLLTVEEQGRLVLKLLMTGDTNQVTGPTRSRQVNRHNFFNRANDFADQPRYGRDRQKAVDVALAAGWSWLEREGLLVRDPSAGENWFLITDKGADLGAREDASAYRKANLLPTEQLHPLMAGKVYATFLRGDYGTAIFQAYREVEVSVRAAGGFGNGAIGVALMREAFAPEKGASHRHEGGAGRTSRPNGTLRRRNGFIQESQLTPRH
jgi:hypothetical protein